MDKFLFLSVYFRIMKPTSNLKKLWCKLNMQCPITTWSKWCFYGRSGNWKTDKEISVKRERCLVATKLKMITLKWSHWLQPTCDCLDNRIQACCYRSETCCILHDTTTFDTRVTLCCFLQRFGKVKRYCVQNFRLSIITHSKNSNMYDMQNVI